MSAVQMLIDAKSEADYKEAFKLLRSEGHSASLCSVLENFFTIGYLYAHRELQKKLGAPDLKLSGAVQVRIATDHASDAALITGELGKLFRILDMKPGKTRANDRKQYYFFLAPKA